MSRIILRTLASTALVLVLLMLVAGTALAIGLPSSTPTITSKNAYRNALETGDFLIIVYENTPYTSPPSINYSEAFIWQLKNAAGTTVHAQSLGYNYHAKGYGYNVIAFYLNADNVTSLMGAGYWGQPYVITLSGTPAAFTVPPIYNFTMAPSEYSSLTDTAEVKVEIANRIITIASDLNNKWALIGTDYELTYASETGTTLSIYGQSFFRGAIYGVQSMASSIFPLAISNVDVAARTWKTTYISGLEGQYTGTYLKGAFAAGEGFFDVTYNLMGILIIATVCAFIIGANWYIGGGNLWKGLVESASPLIIGTRLAMIPLGELGLLCAIAWLYISAKVWKVI